MKSQATLPKELPKLKQWIREQAQHYRETEEVHPAYGRDSQKEMALFWKINRPQMFSQLQAESLVLPLAFVLECKVSETARQYREAGMPWMDAQEQAERDWLLNDPETSQS